MVAGELLAERSSRGRVLARRCRDPLAAGLISRRPGPGRANLVGGREAARLTLSLGEPAAWSWPGRSPGLRKAKYAAADDRLVREGIAAVAEGAAALRR